MISSRCSAGSKKRLQVTLYVELTEFRVARRIIFIDQPAPSPGGQINGKDYLAILGSGPAVPSPLPISLMQDMSVARTVVPRASPEASQMRPGLTSIKIKLRATQTYARTLSEKKIGILTMTVWINSGGRSRI